MAQTDEIWNQDDVRIPVAEPLPFVDYNLIQKIIIKSISDLGKRELDGFTSLVEARKLYYLAQYRLEFAYNGLQDARAYDMILRAEKMKLDNMDEYEEAKLWEAAELCRKLLQVNIDIRKNQKDVNARLEQVQLRWQKRNDATAEFGRKKTEFVKTIWPGFERVSGESNIKANLTASAAAPPSSSSYLPKPHNKYSPNSLSPPATSTTTSSPATSTSSPATIPNTLPANPLPITSTRPEFSFTPPSDSASSYIGQTSEYQWLGVSAGGSGEDEMDLDLDVDVVMETEKQKEKEKEKEEEHTPLKVNLFGERIVSSEKRRVEGWGV